MASIAPEPVSYDARAEQERLARADAAASGDETRRDRRITLAEATARRRQAATNSGPTPYLYAMPPCGRG